MKKNICLAVLISLLAGCSQPTEHSETDKTQAAKKVTIQMYLFNNNKSEDRVHIGVVTAEDTPNGLLLNPNLHGLPIGFHGFHIHTIANCGNNGLSAGGHFDPKHTGKHLGPYAQGHLGDLPVLYTNNKGDALGPLIAPRLKLTDLHKHAIMIHLDGDNYSDNPKKLGGGGKRIACGVAP